MPGGDLLFLDSVGQLLRLTPDHTLRLLARLPSGHYHRTHMTVGPDGSVFVSSGFHIRQVFRVSPQGAVSVVARHLGDPEGIAVSEDGEVLVSSEGRDAEVLRVDLPADVRAAMTDSSTAASPSPSPDGDDGRETAPVQADGERPWWPWALGGVAGVAMVVVLLRSLRPR